MRLPLLILCILTTIIFSCNSTNQTSNDEQVIKSLFDQWGPVTAAKNIDQIMAFYAPSDSSVFFDAFLPREYKGTNAYKKDYENFFAAFPGPIKSTISDMKIHSAGTMAYVHAIDTWTMDIEGKSTDFVFRVTDVLEKINGKWLIVHEHLSFPVDPVTGKADFLSKQ